jgi:hypothetical protein
LKEYKFKENVKLIKKISAFLVHYSNNYTDFDLNVCQKDSVAVLSVFLEYDYVCGT